MKGIKHNMDLFGVVILGLVTGVGGGIVRDSIIGNTPAIALINPTFTLLAIATSVVTFVVIALAWKRVREGLHDYDRAVMFFADTFGLAIFTINGINIAKECDIANVLALASLGVMTGVGGGVMRDVFCGEVPDIFKKHIYAVASAAGASVYLLLSVWTSDLTASISGIVTIVLLRILAAHFRWNLPKIDPQTLE